MVRGHLVTLVLGALVAFAGCRHAQESPAGAARDGDELAVPVDYLHQGVIISTRDGVAAVRFTEVIPQGCKYTYRFLPAGATEEQTGDGEVFENYERGPTRITSEGIRTHTAFDLGSKLFVVAGGITLKWSKAGDEMGYLYFTPERQVVQLVTVDNFEEVKLSRFAK